MSQAPSLLRLLLAFALLILGLMASSSVRAHLMPAQQGTLNVVGNDVFVAVSVPVSATTGADTNGDGQLSASELQTGMAALQRRVSEGLTLYNDEETGRVLFTTLMEEPGQSQFLALMRVQFSHPPAALRLHTTLFGQAAAEQQLTLKVSRGDAAEAVVLRSGHADHRFFRSAWQVFADYVETGVEHIVTGTDHVLFLVTIIVAGAGWRYWLAVLTSFTVAHSITLTLGMLGWVRVNPAIVEPAIAASIVLMAVLNLRGHFSGSGTAPTTARQAAVVFACGLLHGLGFASSMADMGLHGRYQLASLLGFNVGIELGQALCLVGVLAVLRMAGRAAQMGAQRMARGTVQGSNARMTFPMEAPPGLQTVGALRQVPVLASLFALSVGSYWVLERLS
jgi:hydrogenase/urease accessory protein HupE